MNILFICSKNRLRSPTAEQVFADWPGVNTASAGVNLDADNPESPELLEWAELIVVMEPVHRRKLATKFRRHLGNKRVVSLGILDDYQFMQPELVELLKRKVAAYLP
ncbi:low molecular weight protein tyrosine phosphatase family protein [Pseudomonas turukhanskensis]|uniref:Protein-tyrosine-phosphatase n=1 Tax=Pseudomonas turukhanskensis TaxID=1806536 RepID=A0A9W6KET8_9PSED|nr:low molecular weight protein tyrosine phosphatase family protein [Pseudomonas turukhanskensis]GLK92153.1 protein-tyrosine-phosphatase [Pseudomonas turukhanskensis]